jgi:CheY-like chemotaxis protein
MPRILVLHREPGLIEFLCFVLQMDGYESLTETDSHQALSVLRHKPVDLLMMNLSRSDIDGVSFYRILKQDDQLRQLPVLFVSGSPTLAADLEPIAEDMRKFKDAALKLPFDTKILLAAVKEMLVRHKKPLPQDDPK